MSIATARPAIGLSAWAMAVAQAGYPLQGRARRPGSLEALGNVAPVRHDASVALATSCDSVTMHVSTDEAVMPFVTGERLDGIRPGSVLDHHGTGQRNPIRLDLCGSARR